MKIYTYVIAIDAGVAPNYDPPFTTLAICKPRIRHGAEVGDVVLAFTGRSLSPEPHCVCWAGVVSEKLGFAEYWRDPRFAGKKPATSDRPDNIYRPRGKSLVQVANSSHRPEHAATDLGGESVLIFDRTWVFGAGGPILPDRFGLRMTHGRRGHRVTDISEKQWVKLESWLDANDVESGLSSKRARSTSCRPARANKRC